MTYQPNPDAPIASERHPELYERMCKARAFIEQVLAAYVKARKANGMTRPDVDDIESLQLHIYSDVEDQFHITDIKCWADLGETFVIHREDYKKLIEENWR